MKNLDRFVQSNFRGSAAHSGGARNQFFFKYQSGRSNLGDSEELLG